MCNTSSITKSQDKKTKQENKKKWWQVHLSPFSNPEKTFLPQTAVFDEPNTLDTDAVPTIPSDSDSENSSVEILDGGSDVDICEETELARFSRILHDAQKKAQAENAKRKKRKTYSGHSQTTAHHQKCSRNDLAAKGYLSVHVFMKKMGSKKKMEELTFEESEESSNDDAAIMPWLWSTQPSPSEATDIDKLTPAVSEGHCQVAHGPAADEERPDPVASAGHHQATHSPAVSEGRRQVAQYPAASEEYGPAASGGHHQVTQGPDVNEERHRAIHGLSEEEEESTGSEDGNGGSACEDMQDVTSKNRTHLGPTPFEDL